MPRLQRTAAPTKMQVVVSGNKRTERQARAALGAAGLTIVELEEREAPLPPQDPTWGLSSYTDPIEAQKAGHPNAGHTPGTKHPDVLRWLVLDGDHEAGCTRLSPQEWRDEHPEWKPKVLAKSVLGKDEKGKDIVHERLEEIYDDDPRLFLPCSHVGSLEERAWESKHVGEDYEADPRVSFVAASIECAPDGDAMSAAVSKAHAAVESLGWALRRHWEVLPIPEQEPTPLEVYMAAQNARIEALEAALGTKGA